MALADDLALLLESAGVGSVAALTLVGGILPDQPDQLVSLIDYTGIPPQRTHDQRAILGPRVQVRARARDYPTAQSLALQAADALTPQVNQLVNGTRYQSIDRLQDPFFLQRDEKDRVVFAFNLQVFHGGR